MARTPRLESTFEPADAFIGIVTNMPVIQLVHYMNSRTILNLVREKDLTVYFENTDKRNDFRFYHYQDEEYRSIFCLLGNSSAGLSLLPAHKQFGYFLVVQGAIPDEKIKQLVTQIKAITGVQMAAIIKQEPPRNFEPILQDLEIHLSQLNIEKAEKQKQIMPLSEDQ